MLAAVVVSRVVTAIVTVAVAVIWEADIPKKESRTNIFNETITQAGEFETEIAVYFFVIVD